jgi:sugar/nucleoside kinase (ribokinase family)
MRQGNSPEDACRLAVERIISKNPEKAKQVQVGFLALNKKGEHGAMYFSEERTIVLPAFPTPNVIDPTGAGDSFAGGMMGYLAEAARWDSETLKKALAYGTLVASFNVEDFSLDRMRTIERPDIELRMNQYREMLRM